MEVSKAARVVRNAAVGIREKLYSPPGHFLSPVPDGSDSARATAWAEAVDGALPGVDLNEDAQLQLFASIGADLVSVPRDGRYTDGPQNRMYQLADAAVYSALIRKTKPAHIVEVGSGYSSAVALDTADRWHLSTRFTFIEPYPERLLGLLSDADRQRVELRREVVQDSPVELFANLMAGDIVFIDSSHVAKAGSDVTWLLTRVLPTLRAGVLVHIHDIFWPFEYPREWLDERRGWNENYFVHAFLVNNEAFRIVLFNDWVWRTHGDVVERFLPATSGQRPGGLWLEKMA
jgi:predicted O-methyltransferase YrrM